MKAELEQYLDIYQSFDTNSLIELCGDLYKELHSKERQLSSIEGDNLKITDALKIKTENLKIERSNLILKVAKLKECEDTKNMLNLQIENTKLKSKLKRISYVAECTGKIRYDSEIDAHISLDKIKNTSKSLVTPSRKYKCTSCNGWHLTSK